MISLLLTLAGSCAMSLAFKLGSIRRADHEQIVFLNYLVAAIGLTAYVLIFLLPKVGTAGERKVGDHLMFLFFLAFLLALCMVVNLVATDLSTERNGLGSTTFFNRAGFLPCIVLEILIWHDMPSALQIAGMAILLAALFEMNFSGRKEGKKESTALLAVLIMSNGLVSFLNSAYTRYYPENFQEIFLVLVFYMALAMSSVRLIRASRKKLQKAVSDVSASGTSMSEASPDILVGTFRKNPKRKKMGSAEIRTGLLIGVSNIITTIFMLRSFTELGAGITAPSIAAGNVLFSMLTGKFVYGEKTDRHGWTAVGFSIVSMILVNL